MEPIYVSQVVDYEGYSSEYAYATITCDNAPEVTVTITSANIVTWRIRGQGSDATEYCVGVGGARSGTFVAEDGKSYVFQIYSQTYSTYSDGDVFTIDFDSSGDSGDSGGTVISPTYKLHINQGEGTRVTVVRTWNDAELKGEYAIMTDGSTIAYHDVFEIAVEALDGYALNYYTLGSNTVAFSSTNLSVTSDGRYIVPNYADVYITTSATVKSYKLSASADVGSWVTVKRTNSKTSGASTGVLSNGAIIYHFDTLEIEVGVESGYDIADTVVTGCTENDDGTFTVIGDVSVSVLTELLGLIYIDNGTTFTPCLIYIDNGTDWVMGMPYVDNGTSWNLCS